MIISRALYQGASHRRRQQGGFVLFASVMVMVVMALLALSMFRSVGIQHRVAGIMRDKELAFTSAMAAERYAEWTVSQGNSSFSSNCATVTTTAQVCSAALPAPATLPWTNSSGVQIGTTYSQGVISIAGAGSVTQNTVAQAPGYYIQNLSGASDCSGSSSVYLITAYGYGGSANTTAVVQSVYQVGAGGSSVGC